MKKLLAALLALGLLGLIGCGTGKATRDDSTNPTTTKTVTTTEEPTTLDPNRPRAVMEPLQGGPMLYRFKGREPYDIEIIKDDYSENKYERELYPYGLINQDGKVVAEPQYSDDNRFSYVYGDDGRVIGMLMHKETDGQETYTFYTLDGKARPAQQSEFICFEYTPGYAFRGTTERYKPHIPSSLTQKYKDVLWLGENYYLVGEEVGWSAREGILLNRDFEEVCVVGKDLLLEIAKPVGSIEYATVYLLIDNAGVVQTVFDKAGEPLPLSKEFRVLYGINYLFSYCEGKWTSFDLRSINGEHLGIWDYQRNARVYAACEDYIVVRNGKYVEDGGSSGWEDSGETYAIDWSGKPYPNCPLEPYFDQIDSHISKTAAPQGPNYYWIETDSKRGYIDVYGNWLFIDQS